MKVLFELPLSNPIVRQKVSFMNRIAFSLTILLVTCFGSTLSSVGANDQIPAGPQTKPIVLVDGTIHTVSGETIEDGMLLFENGKITAVGKKVKVPKGAVSVSIEGKHVYPGMFEAHTQMGLVEFPSTPSTVDTSEVGSFNPNVKANVAVNPDSEVIPVTRANGVLLAVTAPSGGQIAGQASVLQLDGWTYEDLTLKEGAGMIVRWPGGRRRFGRRGPEPDANNDPLKELHDLLEETRRYQSLRSNPDNGQPLDLRLEAMTKVVSGELPVIAQADMLEQIESAVGFCAKENLKLIILGGYDAAECADLLKKHEVPVIIAATHRLPRYRNDEYDASYTLPARLEKAGVTFAISGSGRSETWNARNLPYHAATAVAFGLDEDAAIRAITLSPAEIMGVADQVGSLDTAKDATLIVTDGSPLEIQTQVEMAFIQGRKIDLSSKHVQLWKKYQAKYNQQQELRKK